MISIGNNITTAGDMLQKVALKEVCDSIREPKSEIKALVRQLRLLRDIDEKKYAAAKKSLPYMVCAIFATSIRRSDDFAYTEYFIIDIDHVSDKSLDLTQLKAKISADSRVAACFVSPGGDGLKVIFKFKERCFDRGLYSRFYKIFAHQFAADNEIMQVVDMKTSDVTRACFLSHDPDIYYNPSADTVRLEDFVDTIDVNAQSPLLQEVEKVIASLPEKKEEKPNLEKEAMDKIRTTLNPALVNKRDNRPPAYVPQELNNIIEGLKSNIEEKGVMVKGIKDIQYGKKITMSLGLKEAEINVFYGKKGFSVIKSPRTGTDADLNDLMADVITEYINTLYAFELPNLGGLQTQECNLPS